MSWINPAMLWGLAVIAIPVALHLLLRARPKRLPFPALRLIELRRKQNVRRLRLRHLWLLLLRMLVLAVLVLAVARPRLPAADYSMNAREVATLAAIVAVLAALYFGLRLLWRRVPSHVLRSRSSLLRSGLIVTGLAALLLLVGLPYQRRIAAEIEAPAPQAAKDVPVAAVFLFDTSLSMEYRRQGQTRLEEAQAIATRHLTTLPPGSKVAVANLATINPPLFLADLSGAQARISETKARAVAHALDDRIRAALELQREDRARTLEALGSGESEEDRYVREIYVFSDLARSAWQSARSRFLHDELIEQSWIGIYLIDVGVEQPTNLGITDVMLSRQAVAQGGQLVVEASVRATGQTDERQTVELYLEGDEGRIKQGQDTIQVNPNAAANARFLVEGLSGDYRQGELRLAASDPLQTDDVGYFTVAIHPPQEILLVADRQQDTVYWAEALAPAELVRAGRARYSTAFRTPAQVARLELADYAAVCLLNVSDPGAAVWRRLRDYVEEGGGLAVFLGAYSAVASEGGSGLIDPVSYNAPVAQSFLPGELQASLKFPQPETLDVRNTAHPLLKRFDELQATGELTRVAIRRYWSVQPDPAANVIASYTDAGAAAAVIERAFGKGRALMMTTGVDSVAWNDFPRSWSIVVLADQMMQYLTRESEGVLNYAAGDAVQVPLAKAQLRRYLLRKPGFQQLPGEVEEGARSLAIQDADEAGNYQIVSADPEISFESGFSVNPPPGESDFTRLDRAALDEILGAKRYGLAADTETLSRDVRTGRIGKEVFPTLVALLMMLFCGEHLVANWFYREAAPAAAPAAE